MTAWEEKHQPFTMPESDKAHIARLEKAVDEGISSKAKLYLATQAGTMFVIVLGLVVGYGDLSSLEIALKLASLQLRWLVSHGAIRLFIQGKPGLGPFGRLDSSAISTDGKDKLKGKFWTYFVSADCTALICDLICLGIEIKGEKATNMVIIQAIVSISSAASAAFGIMSKGHGKTMYRVVSVSGVLKSLPTFFMMVGLGLPFSIYASKYYFRFDSPGSICLFLFWLVVLSGFLMFIYIEDAITYFCVSALYVQVLLVIFALLRYQFNDDFNDIPDQDDFNSWLLAYLIIHAVVSPCTLCAVCLLTSGELGDQVQAQFDADVESFAQKYTQGTSKDSYGF